MFVVCGEALFDVYAEAAEPDGGICMRAVVGGSPFNVAVGLARMDVPTGFLGGLSTDPFGEALLRRLESEGVSTRYAIRRRERTTLSLVGRTDAGEASYAFYGGKAADTAVEDCDLPRFAEYVSGLHFGSYTLVAQPAGDALLRLAEQERRRFISYDPNVRLNVEPRPQVWRATIGRMLPLATLLKISAEDIELLWPGSSPEQMGRDFASRGPALVVVTLGADGIVAFRKDCVARAPARPVRLVDTVGAGDAVQAQLIAVLHDGNMLSREALAAISPEMLGRLLDRAAAAGAHACERQGADPPRRAELH